MAGGEGKPLQSLNVSTLLIRLAKPWKRVNTQRSSSYCCPCSGLAQASKEVRDEMLAKHLKLLPQCSLPHLPPRLLGLRSQLSSRP